MTTYLKIEMEIQGLNNIEHSAHALNLALKNSFAEIGFEDLENPNNLVVNLEEPKEFAVVETAIVLGLIGIAKSFVELYKFLKQKELEEKKLDLEKAKLELNKLSENEKSRLREAFIREDLPQMLLQANITNVVNIGTSIIIQE